MKITNKQIFNNYNMDFDNVLIRPKCVSGIKSRKEINLETTLIYKNIEWTGIPIAIANMYHTGTINMAKVAQKYKILTCLHKFINFIELKNEIDNGNIDPEYVAISIGMNENLEIIEEFPNVKFLVLDVANGYMSSFHERIKQVRDRYPSKIIIAGNIADSNGADYLLNHGADIVKAGIGPGSACRTRTKTGIGVPQFSLLKELVTEYGFYQNINDVNFIMSDGGTKNPADFCKAYGIGATWVMSGSMFAGHIECNYDHIIQDEHGNEFVEFSGMASQKILNKFYKDNHNYRTDEGITTLIKLKGSVENTIIDILGGIRSSFSYLGAKNFQEYYNRADFILVNKTYSDIFK